MTQPDIWNSSPVLVEMPPPSGVEILVVQGRDGTGIDLAGAVPTYADLPTDLTPEDSGAAYVVQSDGKLYTWSGDAWPADGDGANFRGDPGPQGIGIAGITADASGLIFDMTEGPNKSVAVPAIAEATTAAQAAAQSADDADAYRQAAELAATQTAADKAAVATAKADTIAARDATYAARDAASQSALDADADRQDANSSKTAAQTAATTATTKAGEATTTAQTVADDRAATELAKSDALTAASNAHDSAVAAASSETNAGTSEANAHASELAAAQSAADAAAVVNDGIANATSTVKGGILLPGSAPGEVGGTWDHPTVTGWDQKADLVGGKIPSAQIPALATTETYVVASTAERLALVCETGDVAVQTADPGKGTWILKGTDPATPGDWVQLTAPTDAVTSVNGMNGAVILSKVDVGLGSVDNTSDAAKPVSAAQQTALDGKASTARKVIAGTGLSGGGDLTADRTLAVQYGTTAGTAAQGNDARLSDKRAPIDGSVQTVSIADGAVTAPKIATGTLPHDLTIPVCGDKTTRAVGPGDFAGGVCMQRPMTIKAVRYRFPGGADASGSTTVELRKNGAPITGTSKTIAAADQTNAAGSAREVAGLSVAIAKGDILTVYVTATGTTPSKGLYVDIEGVTA